MRTVLGHSSSRERRGSALVLSLLVIFGLMALSSGIYLSNQAAQRMVRSSADDQRAFYLAEAAMAEAMTAIRGGATGSVGNQVTPAFLAEGAFWVQSTDLGNNRTQLDATALAGSGRAALRVVMEDRGLAPLFPNVLNSREQLTLNSNVAIDSYDSSLGTYASQAVNTSGPHTYANANGDVSSNLAIVLNSNAYVLGAATPGPGHGVTLNMGSTVIGSTTPAPSPFTFPPIKSPTVTMAGPYSVGTNGAATLSAGTYGFSSLSIGKSGTLTIQGPANIIVDDFTGGKDASLVIDATAGPVTFYVKNTYSHVSGFQAVPAPGSPMALAFLIESTNAITFPSSSMVRGAYYAPNANITFTSSNQAWGSFAGNRVDMSSSMKFHYDETLSQYWTVDTGQNVDPLVVLSWESVEVTPAFLKTDRRDPFQVLGLNKNALPSPAAAWDI